MRYRLLLLSFAIAAFASCTKTPVTSVLWTEGAADAEGVAVHRLVIYNPPKGTDWTIGFCSFKTPFNIIEGNAEIEYKLGTLYQLRPLSEASDSLVIVYESKELRRKDWAPKGFYLRLADGKVSEVESVHKYLPVERMRTFEYNPVKTEYWDMIPALKSVRILEGTTKAADAKSYIVENQKPGWYRITINGEVEIEAADADGEYYAKQTLENIKGNAGSDILRNMIIEDYPDLQYRGIMLDVARNFTAKENVFKLIDLLARYKVNRLHLHLADDEGWRIEIDGLPELTSFGARRCVPDIAENGSLVEKEGLVPTFFGLQEGYYSKQDYIDILRYAYERRISVIPEIDTPGHSRAAIRSMEKRYQATGDVTYRLIEEADTSDYVSVQDYDANSLNVALPSTYTFIAKVFDEIIAMHKAADVPLDAIHVGGDEVPEGAWTGSPLCHKLMAENSWTDYGKLAGYFVNRLMDIAEERGVKIAGWQEICAHADAETKARLKKNLSFANMWHTGSAGRKDELAYKFANEGINVVLSNYANTYLDFAYNPGKDEVGHSWGGFLDERRAFSLLPFSIYKSVRWDDKGGIIDISKAGKGKTGLDESAKSHIIGVQGQLWSETVKDFDYVTYYIFPKALGLFERGWNARPEWEGANVSDAPEFKTDFNRFYSVVVNHEVPYYKEKGIKYREY